MNTIILVKILKGTRSYSAFILTNEKLENIIPEVRSIVATIVSPITSFL